MTREDFEPLLAFCHRMHQESPAYREMVISEHKLTAIGERIVNEPERFCGLVAVDQGQLAGMFAGCLTEPYFGPSLLAADLALFVTPDRRGGWAAVKLIKAYEAWALERGAQSVQLGITTGVDQARTQALYRRLGFELIGVVCRKTTAGG